MMRFFQSMYRCFTLGIQSIPSTGSKSKSRRGGWNDRTKLPPSFSPCQSLVIPKSPSRKSCSPLIQSLTSFPLNNSSRALSGVSNDGLLASELPVLLHSSFHSVPRPQMYTLISMTNMRCCATQSSSSLAWDSRC